MIRFKWLFTLMSFYLVSSSCQMLSPSSKAGISQEILGKEYLWKEEIKKIEELSTNQALTVTQVISKITFGSCSDQRYPLPIWAPLISENSDLFIGTGDNVYASYAETKPIVTTYIKQLQNSQLQEFRKQTPWIGVWDDHDFGVNDGGGDHPEFEEAKQSYLAYFPNDKKLIPTAQKGIYHSFIVGNKPKTLQVILLDTRTYRSALAKDTSGVKLKLYKPNLDPSQTFLGNEQWVWLENELQRPANFRILVTSTQFIAEEHGFEKWANFPHEKEKLLNLIKKYKIKNLLMISGDRHLAELNQLKIDKKWMLYELTSSGLNKKSTLYNESNAQRVGPAYFESNYGVIDLDYLKRKAVIAIKDVNGKVQIEKTLFFK